MPLLFHLLHILYRHDVYANNVLRPGKCLEKKEAGVFSDQYVSSWQPYAADHILTFLFSAGSYPAFPVIETMKQLHAGKCHQDYKDKRSALIHAADHLFF